MSRKVPRLKTDEEADAFLQQDLSDLDFSQFRPARFEFEKKSERINMRVPKPLLDALKERASHRGIPYSDSSASSWSGNSPERNERASRPRTTAPPTSSSSATPSPTGCSTPPTRWSPIGSNGSAAGSMGRPSCPDWAHGSATLDGGDKPDARRPEQKIP